MAVCAAQPAKSSRKASRGAAEGTCWARHSATRLATLLPHLVQHMKTLLPEFGTPTFRSDGEAPANEASESLRGMGYLGDP